MDLWRLWTHLCVGGLLSVKMYMTKIKLHVYRVEVNLGIPRVTPWHTRGTLVSPVAYLPTLTQSNYYTLGKEHKQEMLRQVSLQKAILTKCSLAMKGTVQALAKASMCL